jgi:endonuclease III
MARTSETTKVLLKNYGRTLAEDLGVDASSGEPRSLFLILIAALLLSARIGHELALKSARILFERGWTTAEKMAGSTWQQRVKALDEGGYVRYDNRTSTMLGETAQMTIEKYGGDLRKLREAAEADPARERKLLKEFKGIGEVGANIFFREVQLAWPELYPFAGDRILETARNLGLPPDARKLASMVRRRRDFVRLVNALMQVRLERRQEKIRALAAS